MAKLAIAVESATDLPARDYGAHCDPWVSVTVLKDRRSIRRRPPAPIAFFRTKTIRHAHNPFYSQTFITDIPRKEMKVLTASGSIYSDTKLNFLCLRIFPSC